MKTGEVLATRVVLKQVQDEDQERAAKKKTEAKKARKLLMKEVENKREDHKKMMKIMLVIKNVGLDLATAMKQFALSVIVYGKITERKEIGYYAILVKLHLVK